MKVFISYSSEDGKAYAKRLYEVLEKRGHDPYLDDHKVKISQICWYEIAKEIDSRDRSIFVITESSQESKGQIWEYRLVQAKYKNRMAFVSEKAWNRKIGLCGRYLHF